MGGNLGDASVFILSVCALPETWFYRLRSEVPIPESEFSFGLLPKQQRGDQFRGESGGFRGHLPSMKPGGYRQFCASVGSPQVELLTKKTKSNAFINLGLESYQAFLFRRIQYSGFGVKLDYALVFPTRAGNSFTMRLWNSVLKIITAFFKCSGRKARWLPPLLCADEEISS